MATTKSAAATKGRKKVKGSGNKGRPKATTPGSRGQSNAHPPALTIDKGVTDAVRDKWAAVAKSTSDSNPNAPLAAVLGEALLVAMLYDAHFEPVRQHGGPPLPGLSHVAEPSVLDQNTGHEIVELVVAVAKVHAEAVKTDERLAPSPMQRAEWVLRELKATMQYAFEAGSQPGLELRKVTKAFRRPTSQDAMALALESFSALGRAHRAELAAIQGFDLALIDEALGLGSALRQRSADVLLARGEVALRNLLPTRNRLLDAVQERVKRIRQAARYVFRDQPEVARRFSSDYQRGRRGEQRKKALAQKSTGVVPPVVAVG